MNLYEITGEYMHLLNMAERGELEEQVFIDTLEGLDGIFEDKADGYSMVMESMKNDIESLSRVIERLQNRKAWMEKNLVRMNETLKKSMDALNKTEFHTTLFTYKIKKNPAKLIIDDESKIPALYFVPQAPKLDKTKLKEAVKAGKELTCAHLEQTERLEIK